MAIGTVYEVSESAELLFRQARTKAEWYEAMHRAGVADGASLNAEDSLLPWEYSIGRANLASPVGSLFVGSLHTEEDGTGDPNVAFHTSKAVHAIASDLAARGADFFGQMLADGGHEADRWLFEPLLRFLERAASKRSAVVVLWGH